MIELWVDKYRPKTFDDYIWSDKQTEQRIKSWVKDGSTDNILFVGPPGVGKTSLTFVILNELGIPEEDILFLNAVRMGNIDTIRNKVVPFISSGGWNGMKYVILDEADKITSKAQDSLKADTEEYSETVRWILTSNSRVGISDAIRDRCSEFEFSKPNLGAFEERMINILISEGIDISSDESMTAFNTIVSLHYPSLRGCIRALQRYSVNGILENPNTGGEGVGEWRLEMVSLFNEGKIRAARDLICSKIMVDDITDIYRWLYINLHIFKNKDEALILIRNGLVNHAVVADPEINLSATLIELARIED